MITNLEPPTMLRPKDFAKKHNFLTEPALRWMIFNSRKNGLDMALFRIGRRVLISESLFFQWLQTKSKKESL